MGRKRKTLKQKLRGQIRVLKNELASTKRELDYERRMADIKWLVTDTVPSYRSLVS